MILCIGEILCDFIGEDTSVFRRFAGGAPFNVACNIAFAGGESGFLGKVGRDPNGDFLKEFAAGMPIGYQNILTDPERNTTLAFVALTAGGERSFQFFRHDTADFQLEFNELSLSTLLPRLSAVHIGSLMLSSEKGRTLASRILDFCKTNAVPVSFDVNFRTDIFPDTDAAIKAYRPLIDAADILKFSEDELPLFSEKQTLTDALLELSRPKKLILVTLGAEGAMYSFQGEIGSVPSERVTAIDTTGAGDAFYGALLAKIASRFKTLTIHTLKESLAYANRIGAYAVTKKGAINPF